MSLFEFELTPIESITPWGEEPNLTLSWFALTDGTFRFNVGNDVLFRYSKDIIQHWGVSGRDAEYQIAAIARDFLDCVSPSLNPIPDFLQPLAWDWKLLREVLDESREIDESYEAFRWLGERTPSTSYLSECPEISFIRKGNEIIIGWDNRSRSVDGVKVWESQFGTFVISVDGFVQECRSFSDRLLDEMYSRIMKIGSGDIKAKIALNFEELLTQHESWRKEFDDYFVRNVEPDVSWSETRKALGVIANELKMSL